jgi:16S rRNA (adenine1518-N6/adenine1519-N6)-dimethyltransferase
VTARAPQGLPRQLTLARLAELGIRPDTRLGQHFLLDDNVLGVIDRLAALAPADVVLEVGAGLGVLTAHLARQVVRVHAIELDRRLEPALERSLEGLANVDLVFGDAMRLELGALRPEPTAFVANLPYHVAAPLVLDSIDGLERCDRWCVLVQREIAERLLAAPGDPLYGAPSVLRALALEPAGRHPVSRNVFVPVPRVDSALVAFRRSPAYAALAADWDAIRAAVQAGFSHRRKTLANALALAGWAPGRAEAERACACAGVDPAARAEALEPQDFVRLARCAEQAP